MQRSPLAAATSPSMSSGGLLNTNCKPQTANRKLQTANHNLQTANRKPQPTNHRYHSQIDTDVNSLLGVKDPHPLSIAITGLGGGAFLPAVAEKSVSELQSGNGSQASAPPLVVDKTARCMFFAGLLLPLLLLVLICLPRPQSPSVRFWRVGKPQHVFFHSF